MDTFRRALVEPLRATHHLLPYRLEERPLRHDAVGSVDVCTQIVLAAFADELRAAGFSEDADTLRAVVGDPGLGKVDEVTAVLRGRWLEGAEAGARGPGFGAVAAKADDLARSLGDPLRVPRLVFGVLSALDAATSVSRRAGRTFEVVTALFDGVTRSASGVSFEGADGSTHVFEIEPCGVVYRRGTLASLSPVPPPGSRVEWVDAYASTDTIQRIGGRLDVSVSVSGAMGDTEISIAVLDRDTGVTIGLDSHCLDTVAIRHDGRRVYLQDPPAVLDPATGERLDEEPLPRRSEVSLAFELFPNRLENLSKPWKSSKRADAGSFRFAPER